MDDKEEPRDAVRDPKPPNTAGAEHVYQVLAVLSLVFGIVGLGAFGVALGLLACVLGIWGYFSDHKAIRLIAVVAAVLGLFDVLIMSVTQVPLSGA